MMRRAWEEAGLDPETASLIEAHGAGTPVGDRVEASSLAEFSSASPRNRHLGSVKGNVGHLMSAAGVPSLLKVVLAMQHRVVPATLFGSAPNPKLKLQNSGLSIHDRSVAWDGERVLRAGINGFGFGGTNAHVVVEFVPGAEHHFLVKPLSSGRPHRIAPEMIPGALEGMQAVPFEEEADGAPDLPETKWFETVVWRSVDDRVPSGLPKVIWTIDGEPEAIGEAELTCVRGRVAVLPDTDDPLEAVRHVHCIARTAQRAPFRLITRGAFSFAADPPPRPAAAAAAAYVAALKVEWGDWQVDVVDLEPGVPVEVALRSPVRGISSFRDGRFYRQILHSAEAPRRLNPHAASGFCSAGPPASPTRSQRRSQDPDRRFSLSAVRRFLKISRGRIGSPPCARAVPRSNIFRATSAPRQRYLTRHWRAGTSPASFTVPEPSVRAPLMKSRARTLRKRWAESSSVRWL